MNGGAISQNYLKKSAVKLKGRYVRFSTMKKIALCVAFGLMSIAGCGKSLDPDLEQTSDAFRKMLSSSVLTKSCFYFVFPDGNPTDYINYIFSPLGSAEWPVAMDNFEKEQMQSVGQVTIPRNVIVSPLARTNTLAKEVVLTPNDEENLVILKAYRDSEVRTHFEEEIPLASAIVSPDLRTLCESNIDMGISPVRDQ